MGSVAFFSNDRRRFALFGFFAGICTFGILSSGASADSASPRPVTLGAMTPFAWTQDVPRPVSKGVDGSAVFPDGQPTKNWTRSSTSVAPGPESAFGFTSFSIGRTEKGEGIFVTSDEAVTGCSEILMRARGTLDVVAARIAAKDEKSGVTIVLSEASRGELRLRKDGIRGMKIGEKGRSFAFFSGGPVAAELSLLDGGLLEKSGDVVEWRVDAMARSSSEKGSASFVGAPALDASGGVVGVIVSSGGGVALSSSSDAIRKVLASAGISLSERPLEKDSSRRGTLDEARAAFEDKSVSELVCAGADWRKKAYFGE